MELTHGQKYRATMIKKFGSEELWKEANKRNASKGGKNGTGHTFAHGMVNPSVAGQIGGSAKRVKKQTK